MMRILLFTALAVLALAGTTQANFQEVELGARAMGMGGAFVAVADDATAVHWNPAGLSQLYGFHAFGMRTNVYSVEGLAEDAAIAAYGTGAQGVGLGWMRTGATDLYHEDTLVLGYGRRTPIEGLSLGASVKRFSLAAPGYEYYNDPAYNADGDNAFTGDVGGLYSNGNWRVGATYRNIGEPKLKLLSTTEDPDPVVSEFRFGGSYVFREVMLMTVEVRMPRTVPEYYEDSYTLNLGTEVWFYDAFALRAGMNRDRITAGLGLRTKHVHIDVALLSERRIGSLYRLSTVFVW
jgi:hypothetical protein